MSSTTEERPRAEARRPAEPSPDFAADVRQGLGAERKWLPSRWLYDALGSQLFEAICELPWYPITRAERRLLERHGREMVRPLGELGDLIELGSGSGEKIAVLGRAIVGGAPKSNGHARLRVHLIDISAKALELSESTLGRLPGLEVVGHRASYEDGLPRVAAARSGRGAALALFLGSNVGNFDAPAAARLMSEIRRALRPGDGLLLGADLVRSEAELVLAYDDPLGVTAAFDKNVLQRINAELGGDFDLNAFDHRAVWDAAASRIEMHLVSRRPQIARIPGAGLQIALAEGETIWTESSYKYTPERIAEMGRRAGFACHRQWIDEAAGFATTLFIASR